MNLKPKKNSKDEQLEFDWEDLEDDVNQEKSKFEKHQELQKFKEENMFRVHNTNIIC